MIASVLHLAAANAIYQSLCMQVQELHSQMNLSDYLRSLCMAQRLASNFVKMARAVGSVDASTTVFLCCDIQERFRPIIRDFDKVVTASSMLMKGAQALRCPVIVTEQYPKGLGKTVEELVLHDGVEVFEKTAFSMMIEPVRHKIQSYGSFRFSSESSAGHQFFCLLCLSSASNVPALASQVSIHTHRHFCRI